MATRGTPVATPTAIGWVDFQVPTTATASLLPLGTFLLTCCGIVISKNGGSGNTPCQESSKCSAARLRQCERACQAVEVI
ncbi:MAG: hypothetical protein U0031_00190 [Thermomicrobiales bacterium]